MARIAVIRQGEKSATDENRKAVRAGLEKETDIIAFYVGPLVIAGDVQDEDYSSRLKYKSTG